MLTRSFDFLSSFDWRFFLPICFGRRRTLDKVVDSLLGLALKAILGP